jgi:hypothetical protein
MKMKGFSIGIIFLLLLVCTTCTKDEGLFTPDGETSALKSAPAKKVVIKVAPSGDLTGITDATNIQAALNNAELNGGTVYLTDGHVSTEDHYVVSKGIVVLNGFNGILKGEGKNKTIIEAVKKPDGTSFEFNFNSEYVTIPGNPSAAIWPTVIHFEFPEQVTIRNLTITHTNPVPDAAYFQHIAIWGGDHKAFINNVRFQGDPGSTVSSVGVHAMAGSQAGSLDGEGNLVVTDIDVSDLSDGLVPMWYGDGSTVTIKNSSITNAFWGIWVGGITTGLQITDNFFTACFGSAIRLQNVSNASVSGNTIMDQQLSNWWHSGIYLRHGVYNSTVIDNTFDNLSGDNGQAIFLRGFDFPGWEVSGNTISHNNFTNSDLPGWVADNPEGPGAVFLDWGSSDNYIHEMKFPVGQSKTLCQMIWDFTDEVLTTEYDGANVIHNWEPCENLAERDINLMEPEDNISHRIPIVER